MRAVRKWFIAAVVFGGVFACAAGAQPTVEPQKNAAATQRRGSAKHPKVAPGQECSACHKQQYQQWEAGPHGQNQVKCLVCHGAVEEGFMAKPPISRCEACHDEQVGQLKTASFLKGKTCFTCHPTHALKPHKLGGNGRY